MAESAKVTVILPAYHEEAVIGQVISHLQRVLIPHEIIVVDDGSTDRTGEIAAQAGARVIRHPYNIGNGAAVKSGIRAATGDIIVLMDADGQHSPDDVPRLLAHIHQDYDMVVGARTKESTTAFHRDIANWIFNRYASYIVGYPIPDLTSGFRVIRADLAKKFAYLLPNTFSYPSTITITMFRAGYRVFYAPIVAPKRVGHSKIRPLRDGMRFMMTITRLGVLFVPLKIFIPVSGFFFLIGSIYTVLQLILIGRFSNMPAMLLMISIFIFMIGLISEQIAMQSLRDTSRN